MKNQDTKLLNALDIANNKRNETKINNVIYMIRRGANVHISDTLGNTMLHVAALNGHVKVCAELLCAGADVNARNKNGYTPLDFALWSHDARIVDILKASGGVMGQLEIA